MKICLILKIKWKKNKNVNTRLLLFLTPRQGLRCSPSHFAHVDPFSSVERIRCQMVLRYCGEEGGEQIIQWELGLWVGRSPAFSRVQRQNKPESCWTLGRWQTGTPVVATLTSRSLGTKTNSSVSECGVSAVTASAEWHHATSPVGQSLHRSNNCLIIIFV